MQYFTLEATAETFAIRQVIPFSVIQKSFLARTSKRSKRSYTF